MNCTFLSRAISISSLKNSPVMSHILPEENCKTSIAVANNSTASCGCIHACSYSTTQNPQNLKFSTSRWNRTIHIGTKRKCRDVGQSHYCLLVEIAMPLFLLVLRVHQLARDTDAPCVIICHTSYVRILSAQQHCPVGSELNVLGFPNENIIFCLKSNVVRV